MAELAGCLPRPMRKARANRYQGDAGDSAMDSMTPSNHLDFRKLAAVVAAGGTLFWLYTFYAIDHVPLGDGTGFHGLPSFLLEPSLQYSSCPRGFW